MQAISVSRDLREKFERIVRDGREAYTLAKRQADTAPRLADLARAEVLFAQAWAVADVAITLAPSGQYTRWQDLRSEAFRYQNACRDVIGVLVADLAKTAESPRAVA